MKLTQEQIELINSKCQYNQGIFREPFGIPSHIKEQCLYTKWESGGKPGSCWDDADTVNEIYYNERPHDAYQVLEFTLKELDIEITDIVLDRIKGAFDSNVESDYGYYGDYTDDTIEWLPLSDFYRILEEI